MGTRPATATSQSTGTAAPQALVRQSLQRSFPAWPPAVVERMCEASRVVRFRKGEFVARIGAECPNMIVLLAGSLRVVGGRPDGREYTFAYLEPGHWIGLVPLMDGGGAMADYICHVDSTVALVPAELVLEVLRSEPQVACDLLTVVCRRLRRAHSGLGASSLLLTPAQRLATRLLALANMHGRPCDEGIELALKLSQEALATMVGVTRQTVTRQIAALVSAGVLHQVGYGKLIIARMDALMAIAAGE